MDRLVSTNVIAAEAVPDDLCRVDGANMAVITASDFICNDAYPYWQGVIIDDDSTTLWAAMDNVRNTVNGVASGKEVWLCETGW